MYMHEGCKFFIKENSDKKTLTLIHIFIEWYIYIVYHKN
jgi:hypothetical protein